MRRAAGSASGSMRATCISCSGPGRAGKPVRFRVTLDGQAPGTDGGIDIDANGEGVVREQRLYQLIRQSDGVRDRTFTIEFLDAGAAGICIHVRLTPHRQSHEHRSSPSLPQAVSPEYARGLRLHRLRKPARRRGDDVEPRAQQHRRRSRISPPRARAKARCPSRGSSRPMRNGASSCRRNLIVVTRRSGTERPFSGKYDKEYGSGLYRCICCDTALFDSKTKFDSGTGWPSFWQTISRSNAVEGPGDRFGMLGAAISCARCDAHLGHVFSDGPSRRDCATA